MDSSDPYIKWLINELKFKEVSNSKLHSLQYSRNMNTEAQNLLTTVSILVVLLISLYALYAGFF